MIRKATLDDVAAIVRLMVAVYDNQLFSVAGLRHSLEAEPERAQRGM